MKHINTIFYLSGIYKVIVEPVGKYKKYKSITNVSVVGDNTQEIHIVPNTYSNVFKVYGKGGKNQGIKNVTLSVKHDGILEKTLEAEIGENLWYSEVSMSAYSLYDLSAVIQSSVGNTISKVSAVMHTFRVTDRMEYLASVYYGDYKKDALIRRDNGIYETYKNCGELVGRNFLVINPTKVMKQEIRSNDTQTNQHLGIIDQIQRINSSNPASLTMGNNFYQNEDLFIDGFIPLQLLRTYNSMDQSFHEFGMKWSNSYTYFLQNLGDAIAIRFEDGHIEYYLQNNDGTYEKPDGLARELVANADGSYTLIVDGITIYEFTAIGRLKEIKDLNGNAITFTYQNGLLAKIENDSGFFEFVHNTDGTIKAINDSGNREIKYGYTNGLLTSFTDAEGNTTTYSYDSNNRLNKVISPEKVVLYDITYDKLDRVISKSIQGSTYTYSYDDKNRMITCTEPNGNKIKFHYSEEYQIESEEYSDGTIKYYYEEDDDTEKSNVSLLSQEKNSDGDSENTKENEFVTAQVSSIEEASKDTKENVVELKTLNRNVCIGEEENNTIYPHFHITNTSYETILKIQNQA